MWRATVFAVALVGVFSAAPAAADILRGEVAVHNRIGKTITLHDKSIIQYGAATAGLPEEQQLNPGDMVEIVFFGSEGDTSGVQSITVVPPAN